MTAVRLSAATALVVGTFIAAPGAVAAGEDSDLVSAPTDVAQLVAVQPPSGPPLAPPPFASDTREPVTDPTTDPALSETSPTATGESSTTEESAPTTPDADATPALDSSAEPEADPLASPAPAELEVEAVDVDATAGERAEPTAAPSPTPVASPAATAETEPDAVATGNAPAPPTAGVAGPRPPVPASVGPRGVTLRPAAVEEADLEPAVTAAPSAPKAAQAETYRLPSVPLIRRTFVNTARPFITSGDPLSFPAPDAETGTGFKTHAHLALGGVAIAAPRLPATVSVAMDFAKLSSGWAGPLVFSVWLRRQMRERRMTQRQLGTLAGVNHSTVSRIVSGQRSPSLATATKIVHALRLEWTDEQVATYFDLLPERTLFPTQRVESALRGDASLDDEGVRLLMRQYMQLRQRRRAPAERDEAQAVLHGPDTSSGP